MKKWETLDNESLTLHRHILFKVGPKLKGAFKTIKGKGHLNKNTFQKIANKRCKQTEIGESKDLYMFFPRCFKTSSRFRVVRISKIDRSCFFQYSVNM